MTESVVRVAKAMRMVAVVGLAAMLFGCTTQGRKTELSVSLDAPEYYQDSHGGSYTVRHGELSDRSLLFVKVTTPAGKQYTLPQAISADGVRYTDERELVLWWGNRPGVRLDTRDANQQWRSEQLKEVAE